MSQAIYPEVILLKLQSVFLFQHNLFSKKKQIYRIYRMEIYNQVMESRTVVALTEKRLKGTFWRDENVLSGVRVTGVYTFFCAFH